MNIDLQVEPPQRLAVKLRQKAESFVRQGHPWIYESSIEKINKPGKAGDLCIIFDRRKNKFLGVGLYDPYSHIRIKLLSHGKPVQINENWFQVKIQEAYDHRKPLLASGTTGYRLIFGENDGFPGLICDVYGHVAVVKLYSAVWVKYLHLLSRMILNVSECETIVLRLSRLLQKEQIELHGLYDGQVLVGQLENENIIFEEHGVKFKANVIKGHKTGYFLDHRHNRHKVGLMADGKSVLDVFSYAGGFSAHAAYGGAKKVVSIDISKQAIALCKENVALNNDTPNHEAIAEDAFVAMQKLIDEGAYFDIVVVDPPSFAKQMDDLPVAKKSYKRLASLAIQLTKSGGTCVMASCSSRISREEFIDIIEQSFDAHPRIYRLLEKTDHDIDHPIRFPEGAYLKTGYYRIG